MTFVSSSSNYREQPQHERAEGERGEPGQPRQQRGLLQRRRVRGRGAQQLGRAGEQLPGDIRHLRLHRAQHLLRLTRHQPLLPRGGDQPTLYTTLNMVTILSDNVGVSSSGCSEHEANNPQSGEQGPGAPCNYLDIYSVPQLCLHLHCAGEQDDPGDRAEEGGVQPSDEEQEQEEDLQVPEDPGDARAGGAAGQVEIIQGGL